MRRSTALRLSIAGLAVAPMMTACTVSFGTGSGTQTSAAPAPTSSAAPAQTSEPATQETETPAETQAPAQTETAAETSEPATTSEPTPDKDSASTAPTTPAPGPTEGNEASTGIGKRQKIAVPAGSGISDLELIDLYGGEDGKTSFGRGTGVFSMTNDRPMMLNLRIQLFDAAGKEVAENTGLNSSYTVGKHDWVTSNLIKMPKGVTVKSFRVTLIDKTDMTNGFTITKFDKPTLGTASKFADVPALRGTVTFTGDLKGTVDAKGACITADGKIIQGSETLSDNPTRAGAGGSTVLDYEIPLYDARKMDLSQATCYASA